MNGLDQHQHLRIRQSLSIRFPSTFPRPVATFADTQYHTHLIQPKGSTLRVYPGVLHCISLAKYAVAFFNISHSRFSRIFSARSRESSICSGVTTLPPALFSFPASAALIQLRRL